MDKALDGHLPDFALEEFRKKLPELTRRATMPSSSVAVILDGLIRSVTVVAIGEFGRCWSEAERVTASIDPDDTAFTALALHLGCPLWTYDKRLLAEPAIVTITTVELATRLGLLSVA